RRERLPGGRAVVGGGLGQSRELATGAAGDADGRALVAQAQVRVGRIHQALGRRPEAEAAYRAALALAERLAADRPAAPAYRGALARGQNQLGLLLFSLGRWAEAEA